MKLLFDQNISHRLVDKINSIKPNLCSQVRQLGLENSTDFHIWQYAKENGYTIVTFDTDFYDLSVLRGAPPKVIWLRLGNTSTKNLEIVLSEKLPTIEEFINQHEFDCLEIK